MTPKRKRRVRAGAALVPESPPPRTHGIGREQEKPKAAGLLTQVLPAVPSAPPAPSPGLPAASRPISWQSHKNAHFCPSAEPPPADRAALLISPKAKSTLCTLIFFQFPCKCPATEREESSPSREEEAAFWEARGRRGQTPLLRPEFLAVKDARGTGELRGAGAAHPEPLRSTHANAKL